MSGIRIIANNCNSCGACLPACPFSAILIKDIAEIDLDKCTLCGACVDLCPMGAIEIIKEEIRCPFKTPDKESFKDIWVWGEIDFDGGISPVVFELLNEGRRLAVLRDCKLCVVLVGNDVKKHSRELIESGADKVFVIDSPDYAGFYEERIASALEYLVKKYKPEIFLTGATVAGRSMVPRLAVSLQTGLTADCTSLDIDPETGFLLQTRPAFGGNIMATILCAEHRPQMATIRQHVFEKAVQEPGRTGEIIEVDPGDIALAKIAKKIIERVKEEIDEVPITDAKIIVSGGRGVGGPEGFELLRNLAKTLNGAVGASRAAVDSGWIPYRHQVGQTGKTVAPQLYIACGISGAIQHKIGMQSSEFIVAINKDKSAPIFDIADVGIIGDLFEIIPKLTKILQK